MGAAVSGPSAPHARIREREDAAGHAPSVCPKLTGTLILTWIARVEGVAGDAQDETLEVLIALLELDRLQEFENSTRPSERQGLVIENHAGAPADAALQCNVE